MLRWSTALQPDPNESLSQQVYRSIRGKIINGALPQGSRLRERELAEEFGVSRIPLREAFPQLEADGFIQSSPRAGRPVTVADAQGRGRPVRGSSRPRGLRHPARCGPGRRRGIHRGARRRPDRGGCRPTRPRTPTSSPRPTPTVHDEIVRLAGNPLCQDDDAVHLRAVSLDLPDDLRPRPVRLRPRTPRMFEPSATATPTWPPRLALARRARARPTLNALQFVLPPR